MTDPMESQTANPIVWLSYASAEVTPVTHTAAKIKSFGSLPDGWHYGDGGSAPSVIVRKALNRLYQFLMVGFFETDAFPGPNGQIMVTAYRGRHCIEVTVEADGTFTVARQIDGRDVSFKPEITDWQADLELGRITLELEREKCGTFGSSTLKTSMFVQEHSGNSRSASPAGAGARQFSMNNVESLEAAAYAPMPLSSTMGLAANLPSSGHSTKAELNLLVA